MISLSDNVWGRPRPVLGGNIGSNSAHCSDVRSLLYALRDNEVSSDMNSSKATAPSQFMESRFPVQPLTAARTPGWVATMETVISFRMPNTRRTTVGTVGVDFLPSIWPSRANFHLLLNRR